MVLQAGLPRSIGNMLNPENLKEVRFLFVELPRFE